MSVKSIGLLAIIVAAVCAALFPAQPAWAQGSQTLTISSSAQAAVVLANADLVKNFSDQTGIGIRIESTSSEAAIGLLAAGMSDLALTAQRLDYRHQSQGYIEHPFLKDALAIISNAQTTVDNLTESQLRGFFSGAIKNWKDVGGIDRPIFVVIPAKETALYRNFSRMVMEGQDVDWDIMTANSAIVHDVARRFVGAISFVNQAATQGKPPGARVLKVNGVGPQDAAYPYYQVFSFVTKGQPQGAVKTFMDFVSNSDNMTQLARFGVQPYSE